MFSPHFQSPKAGQWLASTEAVKQLRIHSPDSLRGSAEEPTTPRHHPRFAKNNVSGTFLLQDAKCSQNCLS